MKKDEKENSKTPLLDRKEETLMPEKGQGVNLKKGASSGSSENAEKQSNLKFSSKEERQEIFIPVSGFVWLYPEEISVVNHPAFQRLGNIYQLGHTFLVFRGATHKRLEHAIGTLHVVQRMIDAVNHNCDKDEKNNNRNRSNGDSGLKINCHEERFIRLGALLHDIGHIAFGHTIEDELCLVNKHDSDARLNLIFNDDDKKWLDADGKTLSILINEKFGKYIPDDLKDISASTIIHLLISKPPVEEKKKEEEKKEGKGDKTDPFQKAREVLKKSPSFRLEICRDMIGNTICADILDYIHRDWYHIGKPKTFDERILQYMEVTGDEKDENGYPKASSNNKFVISVGKRPKIRTDAISAILELLEWRYHIAESVLFHRTKLAAAAMLDRAMYELWEDDMDGKAGDIEKLILSLSEEQLLSVSLEKAQKIKNKEGAAAATKLLSNLQNRQLYTNLCTYSFDDLSPDIRSAIRSKYAKSQGEDNVAPGNRVAALRCLENDFGLKSGSIVMYCPTEGMNAKIAEVKIKVNSVVAKFDDYEKANDKQLAGGHLDAQLKRYERLWRVHFFIDRREKEKLRDKLLITTLLLTIDKLVLNNLKDGEQCEYVAETLARKMIAESNLQKDGFDELLANAAYKDRGGVIYYPFDGPSLRDVIKTIKAKDADSAKKST